MGGVFRCNFLDIFKLTARQSFSLMRGNSYFQGQIGGWGEGGRRGVNTVVAEVPLIHNSTVRERPKGLVG